MAIRGERHTLKGIRANAEFSINVPSASMVEQVDFCGIYSGRKVDKSTVFDLFAGDLKHAPMVASCPVNLECRLRHTLDLGAHTLIVGEVIQTHVNESCLTDGRVGHLITVEERLDRVGVSLFGAGDVVEDP